MARGRDVWAGVRVRADRSWLIFFVCDIFSFIYMQIYIGYSGNIWMGIHIIIALHFRLLSLARPAPLIWASKLQKRGHEEMEFLHDSTSDQVGTPTHETLRSPIFKKVLYIYIFFYIYTRTSTSQISPRAPYRLSQFLKKSACAPPLAVFATPFFPLCPPALPPRLSLRKKKARRRQKSSSNNK